MYSVRFTFWFSKEKESSKLRDESRGLLCQINTRSRNSSTKPSKQESLYDWSCLVWRPSGFAPLSYRSCCCTTRPSQGSLFGLYAARLLRCVYQWRQVSRSFLFIQLSLEMAKILEILSSKKRWKMNKSQEKVFFHLVVFSPLLLSRYSRNVTKITAQDNHHELC